METILNILIQIVFGAVALLTLYICWCACKEKELGKLNVLNGSNSNNTIHAHLHAVQQGPTAVRKETLSRAEEKAVSELAKLKGDTLIEIGIQQTLLSRETTKIKQMLHDLLEQSEGHEAMMQNIIGEKAFKALQKIPSLAITVH